MKNLKKALIAGTCSALLVAGSVAGTMAYLTDTKTVNNTFTVGKVIIDLDETDVDLNGVKDGDSRVKNNDYKLMPGHTYIKDPVVTVKAGSEESYVRLLMTINKQTVLDEIFPHANLTEIFNGYDSNVWKYIDSTINTAGDRVYEFRYHTTITPGKNQDTKLDALFDSITLPSTVTSTQLEKLEGLKIDVVAEAIQADGFKDVEKTYDQNAADAWTAFNAQPPTNAPTA